MRIHFWKEIPGHLRSEIGNLLLAWGSTRGALLVVGLLSAQLLPSAGGLMPGNLRYHSPQALPLEVWSQWDSEWYLLIADRGYAGSREVLDGYENYEEEDASGYFPLYPLLVRFAGNTVGNDVGGGVLVSNLSLLVALWFLGRLVRLDHGNEAARFVPWVVLAFPTSLYLSAVYSESLFLMLAIGSLYMARRERWWASGGLACLAALTRPLGCLLLIPLAWELFRSPRQPLRSWIPLGLIPLGTLGFLTFCLSTYGNFLAPLERQIRWRGGGSGPWRAFSRFLEAPAIHGAHNSWIDLVAAVALILALPLMFRHLRTSYALFAAMMTLAPLCTSLWSFSRMSLAVFPLFHLLSLGCARWKGFSPAYLSFSLPLSALFMSMFANGWWVG